MAIKIGIASDHAGFALKEAIISWMQNEGIDFKDFGAFTDERSDYPDYGHALANAIESDICQFGIGICGTGVGISIVLNKHQGIRAALCHRTEFARLARAHNNANVLVLPGRFITIEEAVCAITIFLATEFEDGRHSKRIEKIPVKS